MATDLFVREGLMRRTGAPRAPQSDDVWDDILAYAQCANRPLDQAFKDSLRTVVDAVRDGVLSDSEAQELLEYLVGTYADRQVSAMVSHSLGSVGRPRAHWLTRWRRSGRARSESVCPVCGNRG